MPDRSARFVARVGKGVLRREKRAGTELDLAEVHLPRASQLNPSSNPTTPTRATIAFEQRVGRLRRRVRDERDLRRIDSRLGYEPLDAGDDTGSDALCRPVRRRNFDGRDELARRGIHRNDVGKRAADVDSDAKLGAPCRRPRSPVGDEREGDGSERDAPVALMALEELDQIAHERLGLRARLRQVRRRGGAAEQRVAVEALPSG